MPKKTTRRKKPARRAGGGAIEFNHAMIYTANLRRSVEFYRDILGLELLETYPDIYARLKSPSGTSTIALHVIEPGQRMDPLVEGIRIYFEVKLLETFCKAIEIKGAKLDQQPQEMPWGWTHAYLHDPDGHEISLYKAGAVRLRKGKQSA